MKDRVVRVLPALICEAAHQLPAILHKAVAVAIPELIDPSQRSFYLRPDRLQRLDIPGALEVHSSQQHKERCCIDRPIVPAEGNLPEIRHFSMTPLVQNFA